MRKKMSLQDLKNLFPEYLGRQWVPMQERIKNFPTTAPYNFRKMKIRRKMAKASRKANRR